MISMNIELALRNCMDNLSYNSKFLIVSSQNPLDVFMGNLFCLIKYNDESIDLIENQILTNYELMKYLDSKSIKIGFTASDEIRQFKSTLVFKRDALNCVNVDNVNIESASNLRENDIITDVDGNEFEVVENKIGDCIFIINVKDKSDTGNHYFYEGDENFDDDCEEFYSKFNIYLK